jgi:hypothetical protein
MKRIECPDCRVTYPAERLYSHPGDEPKQGKTYTVVCSVCNRQFDIELKDGFFKRWWAKTGFGE